MKQRLLVIATLLVGVLVFTGCAKYKENLVGMNYLERNNFGCELDTLISPTASAFYHTYVNTNSSNRLYMGQYRGIHAKVLLQFSNFPKTGTVDSVIVTLYKKQTVGSREGFPAPKVYNITGVWDESQITWETFETSGLLGEEIPTVEISSTDEAIYFTLPNPLVQSWFDTSAASPNHGILLAYEPPDTGFVIEMLTKDAPADTIGFNNLTLWVEQDSIKIYTAPIQQDVFIATTEQDTSIDRLIIANGSCLRTFFSFDFSFIPLNATVNRALLTLHPDSALSFPDHNNSFKLLGYLTKGGVESIPQVPFDSSQVAEGIVQNDSAVVNITKFVQLWASGKTPNQGLLLIGYNEKQDLLRRAFYRDASDALQGPRVEIFYSLPPY